MNRIKKVFLDHPASAHETYGQHLKCSHKIGSRMIAAGFCCMIHGLFPFLFTTNASKTIESLYQMLLERKRNAELESRVR